MQAGASRPRQEASTTNVLGKRFPSWALEGGIPLRRFFDDHPFAGLIFPVVHFLGDRVGRLYLNRL